MEDRSGLFNEIQNFSQRKLKKVETNVVTGLGDKLVEKRSAKGLKTVSGDENSSQKDFDSNKKLDLQVGLIMPGLMIGSQDVAHQKKTLEEFGITHIVNLAANAVDNFFADEYNYCTQNILDSPTTNLKPYLEEIFDFIDSGRHAGSCFVHCDASRPGLSRSTAICIAYMMYKSKKSFNEAFNEVKEARPFVKPNDGFVEQLKNMEKEYCQKKKEDDIEDPFTKKKKMEIEAEKAMLKGATSVKNKLQMFKKAENEEMNEKTRCSTPNKLKADWKFGDQSNSPQTNGQGDKSAPKKLTSILGIFQNKDGAVPRPAGVPMPMVQQNSGTVKKWKPVETKGLQRTKDPQVKTDSNRDYSVYERVKKSKSGSKWASKKESLKRQKSKEQAINEENHKPPSAINSSRLPSNQESHNHTVLSARNSNQLPDNESSTKTSKQEPQSKLNVNEVKHPKTVITASTHPPPPPPPLPSEDLFKPQVAPTSKVPASKESRAKLTMTKPAEVRPPQESPQVSSPGSRPALRRRPSQENQEPESAEPVYPWRRRRRSSDLTGQTRRRSSVTANEGDVSAIKSLSEKAKAEHVSASKSRNLPPSTQQSSNNVTSNAAMNSKITSGQPNVKHEVTVKTTPATPTPESAPQAEAKPRVFGLNRPKAKNIVGGSIWTADDRANLNTQNVASNFNRSPSPMSGGEEGRQPVSNRSSVRKEEKHGDTGREESGSSLSRDAGRSQATDSKVSNSVKNANNSYLDSKSKQNMTSKRNEKILSKSTTIQSSSSSASEESCPDEDDTDDACDPGPTNKGLTRSSTAEILKLIKSKTKPELAQSMELIEEDEEIDVLLTELEKEGIDNIDWGELGIGLNEVKDIVENAPSESDSDDSDDDDDSDSEDDEEDPEEKEIESLLKNLENEEVNELSLSDREVSPVSRRCKS